MATKTPKKAATAAKAHANGKARRPAETDDPGAMTFPAMLRAVVSCHFPKYTHAALIVSPGGGMRDLVIPLTAVMPQSAWTASDGESRWSDERPDLGGDDDPSTTHGEG